MTRQDIAPGLEELLRDLTGRDPRELMRDRQVAEAVQAFLDAGVRQAPREAIKVREVRS